MSARERIAAIYRQEPRRVLAWLVSTGRFKAFDRLRRRVRLDRALKEVGVDPVVIFGRILNQFLPRLDTRDTTVVGMDGPICRPHPHCLANIKTLHVGLAHRLGSRRALAAVCGHHRRQG